MSNDVYSPIFRWRFWEKVKRMPSGCWEWEGGRWRSRGDSSGYGRVYLRGGRKHKRVGSAHRVAFEMVFGPIHDGFYVCHKCDNPPCVNPAHLYAGTQFDNMADMRRKGREPDLAGEKNHKAILVESDVMEILRSSEPEKTLGIKYGVSSKTIGSIRRGKNWKRIFAAHVMEFPR